MSIEWRVGKGIRCDLVGYAGPNLSGKRQPVQIFPGGARRGTILGGEFRSLVVRAVPGTRVVLAVSRKDTWELAAWRCVRILKDSSMPSASSTGLPGVRIPDLDQLDAYDAKRTATEFQSSYRRVDALSEGEGWTFGRTGTLANRVAMILVEREDASGRVASPEERLAMALLDRLTPWPDARSEAKRVLLEELADTLSPEARAALQEHD